MELTPWSGLFFLLGMFLALIIIWHLSIGDIYVKLQPPVVPSNLRGPYKIVVNERTRIWPPPPMPSDPPPPYNLRELPTYKELYDTMV